MIEGFQGGRGNGGLRNGIAATMKHFPGAGPNEDGKDSHSRAGQVQRLPGRRCSSYHQIPFKAAIEAGCGGGHALLLDLQGTGLGSGAGRLGAPPTRSSPTT